MDSPAVQGIAETVLPAGPLYLALGMFDGVHLGHRAVLDRAREDAARAAGVPGALTFWPHPSVILRPGSATRVLQDPVLRARLLREAGMRIVITEPFNPTLASLAASEFLPWLRARLPGLAAVYVGENFRFGRGREGGVEALAASGRAEGIRVVTVPGVSAGGAPVSSTRIRVAVEAGDLAAAAAMLGRPYGSFGTVTGGRRLGRTLGFPTLNFPWAPSARPPYGVYAVRLGAPGAERLPGVANYGLRPTVGEHVDPQLEVNVLSACPWGEGDTLEVDWIARLRPEERFPGLEALRAQIARDRRTAADLLGVALPEGAGF